MRHGCQKKLAENSVRLVSCQPKTVQISREWGDLEYGTFTPCSESTHLLGGGNSNIFLAFSPLITWGNDPI